MTCDWLFLYTRICHLQGYVFVCMWSYEIVKTKSKNYVTTRNYVLFTFGAIIFDFVYIRFLLKSYASYKISDSIIKYEVHVEILSVWLNFYTHLRVCVLAQLLHSIVLALANQKGQWCGCHGDMLYCVDIKTWSSLKRQHSDATRK